MISGCLGAQRARHVPSGELGHHDVEQHQVGRGARGDLQRHLAIQGKTQLVVCLQALDQNVEVGLGIVHEQDAAV